MAQHCPYSIYRDQRGIYIRVTAEIGPRQMTGKFSHTSSSSPTLSFESTNYIYSSLQ